MIFIYVIKSTQHKYRYVGITSDIQRRISEHNGGKTKSTKGYAPFTLVLTEHYKDYTEARKREIFLKSGKGRQLLDSLIV
ncbi:MAG: GIY-YIG nuclease family protein [Patescibacteria group bacterium]